MAKKALNFKSKAKEQAWIKAIHSIKSKTNPKLDVAAAAKGNTPIKIKGRKIVVSHRKVKK